MSLSYSPVAGTNLLTVAFDGDLRAEEADGLRDAVQQVVDEQGSVRILLEYTGTARLSTTDVLHQLRGSSLSGAVDKGAVVTDVGWVRGAVAAAKVFVPFPVKVFSVDEHGAALEWVTE